MPGSIYDINLGSLIHNSGIFGKNRDTSFALNIIGIHDPVGHVLIFPEYAALLEQLVYKCRFTMINVGDDRNIPHVFSFLIHTKFLPWT